MIAAPSPAEPSPATAALGPTAATAASLADLAALISEGEVAVLSGAGLSTESGIPDYRGPTGRARPATPMTFGEFTGSAEARRRYWARSFLGWPTIARARANDGHLAVAGLQRDGLLSGVITQNVDGLHQAAGAAGVIELHGALDRVVCLHCHRLSPRIELHARLLAANEHWNGRLARPTDAVKPDGDVELSAEQIAGFTMVDCAVCGSGPLKPDVVFFGENVPRERVAACYRLVEGSRALLVLGSSLTVASGFRFVRRAATLGIPVGIINGGPTRGDGLATVRLDAPLGPTLHALLAAVT